MSSVSEEIARIERQIQSLRQKAIVELKARLKEARKVVAAIERQISQISGDESSIKMEMKVEPSNAAMEIHAASGGHTVAQKPPLRSVPNLTAEPSVFPSGRRSITLTGQIGESIMIGDSIELQLRRINHYNEASLGIDAPRDISIFRGEIYRGGITKRNAESG